jgi:hypothetical protein
MQLLSRSFLSLPALLLLAAIIAVFTGCTGLSQDAAGTGSPPVAPVPYTQLIELALSPADLPFSAGLGAAENITVTNETGFLYRFGAKRGFTSTYTNGELPASPSFVAIDQRIMEFPAGNATLAYAELKREALTADPMKEPYSWWGDVQAGNESFAITYKGETFLGEKMDTSYLVFTKSGIVEMLVVHTKNTDREALIRTARRAAVMIP